MASGVASATPAHGLSSAGSTYIAVSVVFDVLTALAVGARFWSRRLNKAWCWWDDWFILAALVVSYGQSAFNYWVAVDGGLGWHVDQVSMQETQNMLFQLTISQFIYAVDFVLIRFSICFLFLRLFTQKWLRHTVYAALAVNICWGLFVIISALTVCRPIAYNWNLSIRGGYCNNSVKLNTFIVNSIWTIIYDSAVLTLPQFIVWRLHLPLGAKAGLSAILALGIFDIVVSIIRVNQVVRVNFSDVTSSDASAQVWTVTEVSVAIIVACMPPCRVLLKRAMASRMTLRGIFSSTASGGGTSASRKHTAYGGGRNGTALDGVAAKETRKKSYMSAVAATNYGYSRSEGDDIELTAPERVRQATREGWESLDDGVSHDAIVGADTGAMTGRGVRLFGRMEGRTPLGNSTRVGWGRQAVGEVEAEEGVIRLDRELDVTQERF